MRSCRLALFVVAALVWAGVASAQNFIYVAYQAIPGTRTGWPDIARLDYSARQRLSEDVQRRILPDVVRTLGLQAMALETQIVPGGYMLKTAPSFVTRFPPMEEEAALRFAAALGYMLRQDPMLVFAVDQSNRQSSTVRMRFAGNCLTPQTAQRFFEQAARAGKGLGGGYTAFGCEMLFINLRDDEGKPYSGLDDAAFAAALERRGLARQQRWCSPYRAVGLAARRGNRAARPSELPFWRNAAASRALGAPRACAEGLAFTGRLAHTASKQGEGPRPNSRNRRLAAMFPSFFVIDDFFDNPMEVRQRALAMTYAPPDPNQNYPGRMSAGPMLWPSMDRMFSGFVSEPLVGNIDKLHGYFRITYENDKGGSDIHIDTDNVWAGVLYLTLPEHCRGGTEFYRHKQFGTDHAPMSEADFRVYKSRDRMAAMKKVFADRGKDRSKWERTLVLPMRFNRLVLFRSWYWHTAGESFGDRPENARLVQLFFFKSAMGRGRIG